MPGSDANQEPMQNRLRKELNQENSSEKTNGKSKADESTSNYKPGQVRKRLRAVYPGSGTYFHLNLFFESKYKKNEFIFSVDSATLKFGVESDNTEFDFSPDEDDIIDEE